MVRTPRRRAVRMMRRAISPRLAMSRESIIALHPEQAEARALGDGGVEGGGEGQPQDVAGLGRVDHPVVPEPSGGVVGVAFRFIAGADGRLEGLGFFRGPAF